MSTTTMHDTNTTTATTSLSTEKAQRQPKLVNLESFLGHREPHHISFGDWAAKSRLRHVHTEQEEGWGGNKRNAN